MPRERIIIQLYWQNTFSPSLSLGKRARMRGIWVEVDLEVRLYPGVHRIDSTYPVRASRMNHPLFPHAREISY